MQNKHHYKMTVPEVVQFAKRMEKQFPNGFREIGTADGILADVDATRVALSEIGFTLIVYGKTEN